MSDRELLADFAEYLDGEGLIVAQKLSCDYRTLDDLVSDFLAIDAQRTLW